MICCEQAEPKDSIRKPNLDASDGIQIDGHKVFEPLGTIRKIALLFKYCCIYYKYKKQTHHASKVPL